MSVNTFKLSKSTTVGCWTILAASHHLESVANVSCWCSSRVPPPSQFTTDGNSGTITPRHYTRSLETRHEPIQLVFRRLTHSPLNNRPAGSSSHRRGDLRRRGLAGFTSTSSAQQVRNSSPLCSSQVELWIMELLCAAAFQVWNSSARLQRWWQRSRRRRRKRRRSSGKSLKFVSLFIINHLYDSQKCKLFSTFCSEILEINTKLLEFIFAFTFEEREKEYLCSTLTWWLFLSMKGRSRCCTRWPSSPRWPTKSGPARSWR